MKMVTAIIRPSRLESVREALMAAEITRITVSRVTGHGRQETTQLYRGQEIVPDLTPKVRVDIACNDAFVETTVEASIGAAREGAIGDGKIFIVPLEECIRIRTGERGGAAI